MADPLGRPLKKYRDWKTGNYYLYVRPRPGSSLWRLRWLVKMEWHDYFNHPWWVSWEDRQDAAHPKM